VLSVEGIVLHPLCLGGAGERGQESVISVDRLGKVFRRRLNWCGAQAASQQGCLGLTDLTCLTDDHVKPGRRLQNWITLHINCQVNRDKYRQSISIWPPASAKVQSIGLLCPRHQPTCA
jgi:hypothetical protein